MKNYDVNVDMVWSKTFTVKAKNQAEAKKKAFERFKKNPPKSLFRLRVDNEW